MASIKLGQGKYTVRSLAVRVVVVMAGVLITAYGAAAYITAVLGSDPVTAFVQGLGFVTGLSFGKAMNVFNAVFFVVVLILNWRTLGIGSLLYASTLGAFSDIFIRRVNEAIGLEPSMGLRIGLIVTGTIALGIGLGLYQAAGLGAGPSDAFNQIMARKLKLQLRWWRIIYDVIMVIGALIMGGIVHAGTLVGMFLVGPILGPVFNKMSPVVNKWAGNEDLVHEEL